MYLQIVRRKLYIDETRTSLIAPKVKYANIRDVWGKLCNFHCVFNFFHSSEYLCVSLFIYYIKSAFIHPINSSLLQSHKVYTALIICIPSLVYRTYQLACLLVVFRRRSTEIINIISRRRRRHNKFIPITEFTRVRSLSPLSCCWVSSVQRCRRANPLQVSELASSSITPA